MSHCVSVFVCLLVCLVACLLVSLSVCGGGGVWVGGGAVDFGSAWVSTGACTYLKDHPKYQHTR
jgi:hypothetical protein